MRRAARHAAFACWEPPWGRTGATRIEDPASMPDPASAAIARQMPLERSVAWAGGGLQCAAAASAACTFLKSPPRWRERQRSPGGQPTLQVTGCGLPSFERRHPTLARSPVTAVWASLRDGRTENSGSILIGAGAVRDARCRIVRRRRRRRQS